MNRRKILGLSSLVLVAIIAISYLVFQPFDEEDTSEKKLRVGVINLAPVLDPVLDGFKAEMETLGYTDVEYIYQGPIGDVTKLEAVAADLVDQKVDIILALSTPAALAVQKQTTTIPVVFAPINDPIGPGLVGSLSQPGANLTGVAFGGQENLRFQWLLRVAPDIQVVFIPYNPDDEASVISLTAAQETAQELGVEIRVQETHNNDEISALIADFPDDIDAIYLTTDSIVVSRAMDFVEVARTAKLPLGVPSVDVVKAGALVTYTFKFYNSGQQAAQLADQILRGENPAGLPVEYAEFFLAVNLNTAETIGLEIPDTILAQADEVYRD